VKKEKKYPFGFFWGGFLLVFGWGGSIFIKTCLSIHQENIDQATIAMRLTSIVV